MKPSRFVLALLAALVVTTGLQTSAANAGFKPERVPSCMLRIAGWHNACMYVSETLQNKWAPRVAIVAKHGSRDHMLRCGAKHCGSISFVNHTVIVKLAKGVMMTAGTSSPSKTESTLVTVCTANIIIGGSPTRSPRRWVGSTARGSISTFPTDATSSTDVSPTRRSFTQFVRASLRRGFYILLLISSESAA